MSEERLVEGLVETALYRAEFTDGVTVRTLSPISCYSPATRDGRPYTVYHEPDDDAFEESIYHNLVLKFRALMPGVRLGCFTQKRYMVLHNRAIARHVSKTTTPPLWLEKSASCQRDLYVRERYRVYGGDQEKIYVFPPQALF